MFDLNIFWLFVTFIFGLLWGSFANVVILRMPRGESVAFPRSHCPHCKVNILWFDNIPVISWFLLKGKCRKCRARISFRYPLVELLTGCVFALTFYKYGFTWYFLELLIFSWGLIVISFIDIDHFIIPDKLSLSGIVIGLLGAVLNPDRIFLESLFGVLLGGGFLWLIAFVYYFLKKQEGMGGGDIKLLAWIGAVCGWRSIPFVILVSSIIGSIVGLLLMKNSKKGLQTVIPFGPYLAIAALIYIFAGHEITLWYLKLFFPWLE